MCIHVPFTHTCTTKYYQNMIYLIDLPSVLYERPGQNERSVLNKVEFFLFFQVLFSPFYEKHHFSYKKCHILWKQTKQVQYACIHVPFTHTFTIYTTKYHQNKRYILLAFSLYSMKHQVKMRDLCFEWAVFVAFHINAGFHAKSTTFHENKQNRVNMCVYMYHLHIHAPHTPPNTTKI